MGRRISTGLESTGSTADGYFDKVVKYIPSDVIAAWTAVSGLLAGTTAAAAGNANTAPGGSAASDNTALWIALIFGAIITALWTWKQTTTPGLPAAVIHIAVATISFVIWVFALGPPFNTLGFYNSKISSVVLIGWTLVLGLIPADSPQTGGDPPPNG